MADVPPVTRTDLAMLRVKVTRGVPLTMLTCYDYPTALLEDAAGIDIVFVGDSVGTNVLGYASEREVTMADMVHHLRAVRRGVSRAWLLVDLPYGSYATPADALANARRLLAEGADAVKLEGGREQVSIVQGLVAAGITVCGHLGYTPQTLSAPGQRPTVQGRTAATAIALIESALALERAGLAMVVLELVPEALADLITRHLSIPTIGIGAGRFCSGQVLVINDVLGITPFRLRLAKRYQEYHSHSRIAIEQYRVEVEQGSFPGEERALSMPPADLEQVEAWLRERA